MSLKARLERVEQQLGLDGGGCAACCDWRGPSCHVRWGTDEPLPLPERCPSCGRMRPQFVLVWKPPEVEARRAQQQAQQTLVPLPPEAPAAEVLEGGLQAPSGMGSAHGSVWRKEVPEPARGAGAAREQPAAEPPLEAAAAGDLAVSDAGGAAVPKLASWERWPTFVAAYPIDVDGLHLRTGEPFPSQDKRDIRRYGPALGVPDAGQRPFHTLPYVTVRRE